MSAQEFDLNLNTARLLMEEPFFAAISRRIDKRASYAIPTAGVMVNPDTAQFEMLYNPKFFADLTDLQRSDILKHEFYHILFEHVTGRMPADVNMKLWNIAADLAINSHLHNLPEGGLIPGEPDTPFEHFLVASQLSGILLTCQSSTTTRVTTNQVHLVLSHRAKAAQVATQVTATVSLMVSPTHSTTTLVGKSVRRRSRTWRRSDSRKLCVKLPRKPARPIVGALYLMIPARR